jgi:hypothetical protein
LAGTFLGKFKPRFPGPFTRASVNAVAALSAAAVHIIFPAAVIPTFILGTISPKVTLAGAAHDRRVTKRAQKEQAEKDRRQAELNAAQQQRIDELWSRLDQLQAAQADNLRTVDNDAVSDAELQRVSIDVQRPPEAA